MSEVYARPDRCQAKCVGKRRRKQAEAGIAEMKDVVDTLIVIPNQRLLAVVGNATGLNQAFKLADSVLPFRRSRW